MNGVIAKLFIATIFLTIISTTFIFAQGGLQVYGRIRINKGNTDNTQMIIIKDGSRVGSQQPGRGGKFDIKLEYDADYILSFEKQDYVTKKISINTSVSSDFARNTQNIIDFEVELEPQTDLIAIKIYDNPVAKIRYDARSGNFDYDTNYSASFQKQIREEEKRLAEDIKKKEIEQEKQRISSEAEKRKQEAEAQKKATEEARKVEQEKLRKQAEERRLAEEQQRKAEEKARLAEQERKQVEAEQRQIAEAKAKEDERKRQEELRRQETEKIRLAEEARKKA
ncbi:MAG: hypothetical protein PHE03_13265, partial [Bacteroidales bacterium]|nr:hypothetical protein [Bacteroidales bacterium]